MPCLFKLLLFQKKHILAMAVCFGEPRVRVNALPAVISAPQVFRGDSLLLEPVPAARWTYSTVPCWPHRVAITLRATHAREVIEQVLTMYATPEISQHRPRQPIRGRGVHARRPGCRLQAVDGRARCLARQRVRRAPVAQRSSGAGHSSAARKTDSHSDGVSIFAAQATRSSSRLLRIL